MSNIDDAFPKTPDAVREERMIALLEQLNNNLAIMGQAMIKLADAMMEPEPEPEPLPVIKKGKKNVKNT